VLRAKERAPTPSPSIVFTFGLAVKSIKELGGASTSIKVHMLSIDNNMSTRQQKD
jgi:hypothetical protein